MKDVLLIDQTKPIRVRLSDICKNLNLTAYEAIDSNSALSVLNKHHNTIGCIVMEIKFDHFDGLALLERIKTQYDHIPVMILTSSNKRSDFVVGLKLGALDYVLKPFDDINLIIRIRKIINMSSHTRSAPIHAASDSGNVNIKDMIQMEIKKAQKGQYVFVLFMFLIYKPLDHISTTQDAEYEKHLNDLYPELQRLFWETDHLSKFGTQLILGLLPFCDEHGFNIVEEKLRATVERLISDNILPNDYHMALSHQLLPVADQATAESILDQLQISVRKQVSQDKKRSSTENTDPPLSNTANSTTNDTTETS